MSPQFRQRARRDYGVTVTVPVQFFDWSFKYESAPQSASAIKELTLAATRSGRLRVAQPYRIEETGEHGDDVVAAMETQIESHRGGDDPLVWFTTPAGTRSARLHAGIVVTTDPGSPDLWETSWDELSVVPEPASGAGAAAGLTLGVLARRRPGVRSR